MAGAFVAIPSAASAQGDAPLCKLGGSVGYQAQLGPMLMPPVEIASGQPSYPGGGADGAAREALGAQYAMVWLDGFREGWSVAYSPGPLDGETARAAIRHALESRFASEQVAYLDGALALYPTPFSSAELQAVVDQLGPIAAANPGLFSGWGISCNESDAVRVQVSIGPEGTPDIVARTEALLAPFGDKVHVTYGAGWAVPAVAPSSPLELSTAKTPAKPAPVRFASYATLPKRGGCGRAVAVRAAKRADLQSVRLAAGKRKAFAKAGKQARLALKTRSTKVTVTVRLRDGRTVARTFTFKRC